MIALLGLAIIIAILGIVNTLFLSVLERTREIGMLRAVGTSRWQVRWMVVLESVVIALFGAVLGVVLGVIFADCPAADLGRPRDRRARDPLARAGPLPGHRDGGRCAGGRLAGRRAARLDVLQGHHDRVTSPCSMATSTSVSDVTTDRPGAGSIGTTLGTATTRHPAASAAATPAGLSSRHAPSARR